MKKNKVEKGKVSNDGKKTRRSVEKEVISGEEDPDEETIEAKETEEEEEEEVEMVKDAKVTTMGRRSRLGVESGKASNQSGDLVGKELVDFQNNFNLVTSAVPGRKTHLSMVCPIMLVDKI